MDNGLENLLIKFGDKFKIRNRFDNYLKILSNQR